MLNFIIIVSILVWVMTSIMFAATCGAMFAPTKRKIIILSEMIPVDNYLKIKNKYLRILVQMYNF